MLNFGNLPPPSRARGVHQNSRKFKRFLINANVTVNLPELEWIKSVVVDISYKGICLQGPKEMFNTTRKYTLHIETIDTFSTASAQARFRSASPGEGQPYLHFEILSWMQTSAYLDNIFSEKWLSHLKQPANSRIYHNGKFARQTNARKFQRLTSPHKTIVFDLENNTSSEGEILNISEGGIKLKSSQPFLVGSKLSLKLFLDDQHSNTISAYVKWTHFIKSSFYFETGIQFEKSEIRHLEAIRKKLEQIVRQNPMSLA